MAPCSKPLYDSWRGLTITHGICPRLSSRDARTMAPRPSMKAYRAHIALGGDPARAVALDNFCWPDPVESALNQDGAYKLAQLVRACEASARPASPTVSPSFRARTR